MNWTDVFQITVTAVVASTPSIILVSKYRADAKKTLSESSQIDADIINKDKQLILDAKRTEVEIAERLIKSAGELIENYKDMIVTFNAKVASQDEKLNNLSMALHAEVKKREKLERTLKDFIVGIKRLLAQLRENKIVPVWEPKIDIDVVED